MVKKRRWTKRRKKKHRIGQNVEWNKRGLGQRSKIKNVDWDKMSYSKKRRLEKTLTVKNVEK